MLRLAHFTKHNTTGTLCLCADAARLHDVLEQLEPISERHRLSAAAGMSNLIHHHKALQQQIAETQQRAAKLQLVAEVEKRQAQFEACLSAGMTTLSLLGSCCNTWAHQPFLAVTLHCSLPTARYAQSDTQ